MTNCGIASGFAPGYDPTGRSVYYIKNNHIKISIKRSELMMRMNAFLNGKK
jgi:hypothetical protein